MHTGEAAQPSTPPVPSAPPSAPPGETRPLDFLDVEAETATTTSEKITKALLRRKDYPSEASQHTLPNLAKLTYFELLHDDSRSH